MARATYVKSARKDNPVCKKGEGYWWWKFQFGSKQYSLTPPERSQLTQSSFLSQLYALQDESPFDDSDQFDEIVDDFTSRIQELSDECQESLENMPEQLQYAPTGELLQERMDALEGWIGELESIDLDIDEDLSEADQEEQLEEIRSELQDCQCDI